MIDTLKITVITRENLRSREGLVKLLDSLEQYVEFVPTHWGPDERALNSYDREEVLSTVTNFKSNMKTPGLCRRTTPRYEGWFDAAESGLKNIKLEFEAVLEGEQVKQLFTLGGTLAENLTAEFGSIHPIWLGNGQEYKSYNGLGVIGVKNLRKYGPNPVCARTWYGPYLISVIGRENLFHSGAIVKEMPWGGLQVDLVEEPWLSNVSILRSRQDGIMKKLLSTGVFGEYATKPIPRRGAKWPGIPESI